ncbi:MAG: hypothetical protein AAGA00_08360 [Pseudomonadota bacterium]
MIFRSMWTGDDLGPLERLCIASFVAHGHNFELFTDGDFDPPAGCTLRPISDVCPDVKPFAYKSGFGAGSYSAFSNVFRYTMLYRLGGWWVDTDIYCLSQSWPEAELLAGYQNQQVVNSAVLFAAKPGERFFSKAMQLSRQAGSDVKWGEIGPNLVTRLVHDQELGSRVHVKPSPVFYPVGHREFLSLLVPGSLSLQGIRQRGSVCLHLWNEMFRFYKLDKTILAPKGSVLRECFEEAGMTSGFEREYRVDRAKGRFVPVSRQPG